MSQLVFFDLDGTLFSYNSAYAWLKRERQLGFLTKWQALQGSWWLFQYGLGIAAMEDAIRKAALTAKGQVEAEVKERVRDFWETEVSQHLRQHSSIIVEEHRRKGDVLALLTSSSNYLSYHAAQHWNIPHILANRFLIEDGCFSGQMVEPICYGTGKLYYAKQLAEKLGFTLADCVFYTDSYSDFPAMEAVGRAVAVHPDRRLKKAALQRGWEICWWD